MASLPELTSLFTKLALNLRRHNASAVNCDDGDEASMAISSLTETLNSDTPRIRVLDAALSLMCFKTSEVFSARIECLIGTIVSVLSSLVSCKVSRFSGCDSELLRVGSSMSSRDCDELIRVGADVLESLEGHSGLSHTLLYAILKAAVSSSSYQISFPLSSEFNEENERISAGRRTAISKLMCFLPDEISVSSHEIPLRLFLWYLDPLILKHDISEMLRETTGRPFLSLKKELHARMSWRSIIICLVTSPTMFLETRALLHSWFLLTGLVSVLDLQIAIISSVLDVLSRPMWWGVSMEMGLKYPFSHAYFPNKHRELLAVLTGPVSCESFLDLVRHIRMAATPTSKYSDPSTFHTSHGISGHEAIVNAVDINSTWAMLMNFPTWFYFATILIFCGKDSQDSCLSKAIYSAVKTESANDVELQKAAAQYLSWVLSPIDETHCDMLTDCIQEISRSWTMKNRANCCNKLHSYSDTYDKNTHGRSKKLRMPKVNDCGKLHLAEENDSASAIGAFLKEFDGFCVKLCSRTVISYLPAEAKGKQNAKMQPRSLFLRIPVGILIVCPSYLDEKGCELLLHYATTGELLQLRDMLKKTQGCLGHDLALWSGCDGRSWALDGASLVFSLFDIIEDMSVMLFDSEDAQVDFICQMKGKASRYLLRCVKTLLELPVEQFQIDEVGGRATMVDLFRRLTKWMQQGREVFEGYRAFDDVDDYARRFKISEEEN